MTTAISKTGLEAKKRQSFIDYFLSHKSLYFMMVPGLILLIVFKYLPMYGIVVSFMNYVPVKGIMGSKWVGLDHYIRFINDPYFFRLLKNTFFLGFYTLLINFPAPILLALFINEVKKSSIKRSVQTISYMPHFLSVVIVVGIMMDIFRLTDGVVNNFLDTLGINRIHFFGKPEWFRFLYITTSLWQNVGYGTIIYLAAISNINVELYESAHLDGVNRLQKAAYITVPSIIPTIVILFILRVGSLVANDFEKILLMYNPSTFQTADVLQTYIFRQGIEGASFSYAASVGMFLSVISFILLYMTNKISKKVGSTYLW